MATSEQLEQKLHQWVAASVIDSPAADRIRNFESTHDSRGMRWPGVLAIAFGAIMVGDGVLLFVGDLSWAPNAEGLRWFADSVWPLVRSRLPRARVEVLGRAVPPDLRRRAPDWIFLGEGGDTRPLWARADVAIVPLRAGGGTRLKILEAAACGVPVVSTTVGAEGLELASEAEILLRDDPPAFADALVRLLGDTALRRGIAASARLRVEKRYDWRRVGAELAAALLSRAKP